MKEDEAKLAKEWIKTRNKGAKCSTYNCINFSAKNHLLQENGILSEISTNGKVRQLLTDRFKPNYYSFHNKGLDDALIFKGLCSQCDSNIFKPIEQTAKKLPENEVEFCLYAYRAVLNEIRKKENNLQFSSLENTKNDYLHINLLKRFSKRVCAVIDGKSSNEFIFDVKEINRVDICACSILIPPIGYKIYHSMKEFPFSSYLQNNNHDAYFFIFFPIGNKSYLITGYHKHTSFRTKQFHNQISTANEEMINIIISDILIGKSEDWCVSEKIYNSIFKKLEPYITVAKVNQFNQFNRSYGLNILNS